MNKIVLAGGSGFLGKSAAFYFRNLGYQVVVLSRSESKIINEIEYINWDAKSLGPWVSSLENSTAIINFTGKSVNCIYTETNKREIIDSRINSVKVIDQAVLNLKSPPKVIIQAASLAIFGDTKSDSTEESLLGKGFSVDVCKIWEDEFFKISIPDSRKVILRIGFVLGKNGGAIEPLTKLAKWFLGGSIGDGTQFISWIHIEDMNRMFEFCINQDVTGIFNATGPDPVENKFFMKALRKAVHRPWSPPAPKFIVKLGAFFIMKADSSLALTGRKCFPKRFIDLGFQFKHTDLLKTLEELV
ncbi:TIGR01777 family protein [Leptospira interrogans serovar Zanoni str. LT2156]|uniref:TIGR01777 family protein n=1 Tax=Leptospira interrogans serovar Zanoni str. LT2156 TaxID=1001601 RepID=M6HKI7_LEPIR|nr:TIGR01777 family protein [Leptospira interrogans serovar Zanoni str. LT2156]